jgi:SAM-dependent methyltransferase
MRVGRLQERKWMSLPLDPIVGLPAVRCVTKVPMAALLRYWRVMACDLSELYRGLDEIGLYEAQNGMLFTHPMIEGDGAFYEAAYRRLRVANSWKMPREEHMRVAAMVGADDRVLDIGCGDGIFGRALAGRGHYVGLDFAVHPQKGAPLDIRIETLEQHFARGAEKYDVVTAFHVVEHVTDPVGLTRELAEAARPGGRVVIALPSKQSKMVELPAFPINFPPHHLTHWTAEALGDLAVKAGLVVETIHEDLVSAVDDAMLWMHHHAPLVMRNPGEFLRLDRQALRSLIVTFLKARFLSWNKPYPRRPEDKINLLMVARVPE